MSTHLSPAQIHSRLKHPVVDADGHWLEFVPVFSEKMRKAVSDKAADGFRAAMHTTTEQLKMTQRIRDERRVAMPNFWNRQAENTLDRATAMMPKMLYERLDEIGTDFAVIYPTAGLRLPRIKDDETRRAVIRAYNIVSADYFRGYEDRMTPAAIIPMHTPEEAIAELEFVTKQLGAKVGMFGSGMPRQVSAAASKDPEASRFTVWYDVLGIDSPYDYDPVWRKCVEVKMAPTFHSSASGQGLRNSPSNFVYNHVGHFAAAGHAVAKAIFLGGVTRRFPELNFAFLEGGVGWGCQLFGDLVEHWERRGAPALKRMDPDKLDRKLLLRLVEEHGYEDIGDVLRSRDGWPDPDAKSLTGQRDGARRLRGLQAHAQGRLVGALCEALLLRMRGRRPDERNRLRPRQSVRRQAERDLQLGYRPLRRDRLPRSVARSLRARRRRPHQRRRLPQLRVFKRGAAVGQAEPELLRGHGRGQKAAAVLAAQESLQATTAAQPLVGSRDARNIVTSQETVTAK